MCEFRVSRDMVVPFVLFQLCLLQVVLPAGLQTDWSSRLVLELPMVEVWYSPGRLRILVIPGHREVALRKSDFRPRSDTDSEGALLSTDGERRSIEFVMTVSEVNSFIGVAVAPKRGNGICRMEL